MAKKNLLLDRYYLIGDAKDRRIRQQMGTITDQFCGHPSLKESYAPYGSTTTNYGDFFRGASAHYWGFTNGHHKGNFRKFGYLRGLSWGVDNDGAAVVTLDPLSNAGRVENYVSYRLTTYNQTKNYNSGAPSLNACIDSGRIYAYFGYPSPYSPPGQPNPGNISFPNLNGSITTHITITPDDEAWGAGSNYAGIPNGENLHSLRVGQIDNTWDNYVTGGFSTPTATWRGLMNEFNNMYYDHAHQFWTPVSSRDPIVTSGVPVATKVATITPHYNFFAKKYEEKVASLDDRVLPNGYMLLNAIDYSDPELGPQNSDRVQGLYRKLSCLYTPASGTAFQLPGTRDHIASLGYGDEALDPDSPLFQKSYIQKYSSVDTENYDFGFITTRNEHVGYAADFVEADFVEYSDGLSGMFLDPSGDLEENRGDIFLPFDITLEFDTKVAGYDVDREISTLFSEIPGAYDFLLNHIMMANISSSNDTDAFMSIYDTSKAYSAEITNPYTEEKSYYGFEWVHSSDQWGTGTAALNEGGPWFNSGTYHLKTIDLPWAFTYCWNTLSSPVDAVTVPNPLMGQAPNQGAGVAFGKGVMVGRHKMAKISSGATFWSAPYAWEQNKNTQRTVMSPNHFKALLRNLGKIATEKKRTYAEILDGKLAYSETLAYRVAKHLVNSNGVVATDPIQNFYLPSLNSINKMRYVDTQVRYGQKYKYIVYAYNLVVGDAYSYKNLTNDSVVTGQWEQDVDVPPAIGESPAAPQHPGSEVAAHYPIADPQDSHPGFTVNQFGSIQLIEAPYFEYDPVEIRDLPPVFPEVEVVPFRGVSNKIRFLLQTQNVKYAFTPEKFIIEGQSDLDAYTLQREYQMRPTGPIVFGSDDTEITFDIYRTTVKPTSYEDFSGMMLDSVEGLTPSGNRAVSIGYDDKIEPNQVYYYTFRCTDYHGGISIPSPIYKIELVDDNGRIFPRVEVYHLMEEEQIKSDPLKSVIKPGKKYLQVGASLAQSLVNTQGLTGEVISPTQAPPTGLLSTQSEGIWSTTANKKVVKIRMTSKHTGKKIDLNVELFENPIPNPNKQE